MEVAGLLPKSTRTEKGLMGAGVRVHTGIMTVPAKSTKQLPYRVAGLVMVKNGYSWGGYHMYVGYMNAISQINVPQSFNPAIPVSIDSGYVSVENVASADRQFRYVIFNMSDPNDTAEYLQD